jgi:hypothetical protein
MKNESNYYKTPWLFAEEFVQLKEAVIIAQNYWGDKRNGTLDWDSTCQKRIDELERVLYTLDSAHWKNLPEPPTKEI